MTGGRRYPAVDAAGCSAVTASKQIRADGLRPDAMLHEPALLCGEQQRTHSDFAQALFLPYWLHHSNPRVCIRTQQEMTQFVRGDHAQQAAGVNVSGYPFDSIEEDVAVPPSPILPQERHSKDRILTNISDWNDVQDELIRSWRAAAFLCLGAIHPLNLDIGGVEQSCRLTLSLSQDGCFDARSIIHQHDDLRALVLRDREAAQ